MNRFAVMNPATGTAVADAPDNGPAEARAAAARTVAAFATWKATTAYERSAILEAWTGAILAHEDELARLMAQEMGKPVTEARGEVRYAASFVKWYAEEAKRVYGETIPSQAAHKRLFVRPQPVGPVYAITPWNFPAAMITRKAAPALAAGCTVVVKPAEQSPLTAIRLAELWTDAGGPADVLQVLPTSDPVAVSKVFFDDPAIRKLSFTGSTAVGIELAALAARTVKRVSLELGGHAPFLVFEDADLDAAVREVAASKFRNAGQTCVCANRIYVHERVHDEFVARFSELVKGLRVGDPMNEATQVGPLVDGQHCRASFEDRLVEARPGAAAVELAEQHALALGVEDAQVIDPSVRLGQLDLQVHAQAGDDLDRGGVRLLLELGRRSQDRVPRRDQVDSVSGDVPELERAVLPRDHGLALLDFVVHPVFVVDLVGDAEETHAHARDRRAGGCDHSARDALVDVPRGKAQRAGEGVR